ncbi:MAG: phosphocholine cytidylyltransferase family protein [Planctomycetes bacterium]|nr:phosphocholine cytidylyltransferase family protein [Planctomycetota bacterium]
MKAVILSAGQGRRLLPLTRRVPKCALNVSGRSIIHWQIDVLMDAGIDQIVVVLGHGASQVEALLARHPKRSQIRTLYNPFHSVSDNLATAWLASPEMDEDFLLLNGDTLFEQEGVRRVLASPTCPVTVTVDEKDSYDDDDMRVTLDGTRLVRIGKHLRPSETHAESIGMLLFRGDGPARFRWARERAVRKPEGLEQWYLTVVDELGQSGFVSTASIKGLRWAEVDTPADLDDAAMVLARRVRRVRAMGNE